ncbi:MAG: hypothetical protein GXO70_04210 [Acidobacteria bacterium]|nr:hypothetical protein [Acidobacteriota bacterium]
MTKVAQLLENWFHLVESGTSVKIKTIAKSLPAFASVPALIIVGAMMMKSATRISWSDLTEAVPFTYSFATGIAVGFILYPLSKLFTGCWQEVSIPVWVLMRFFVIRFIYLGNL